MSLAYSERRRLLDHALEESSAVMAGTVLEIGAGRQSRRGRFTPPVHQVAHWWCVDLRAGVRPDVAADVEALPLRPATVDTVVSLEVLEYVPRPDTALAEMHRVLRPGGHVVLSVPFMHRMDSVTDRWRFSERGVRDALAAAGLSIVTIHAQGGLFTAIAHLVRSVAAQQPRRVARGLLGCLSWPLVALGRLEGFVSRPGAGAASVTTGYLVIARK